MKKLQLNFSNLNGAEMLSRTQLKNVLGGSSQFPTTACQDRCGFGSGFQCDAQSVCVSTNSGCLGCVHE